MDYYRQVVGYNFCQKFIYLSNGILRLQGLSELALDGSVWTNVKTQADFVSGYAIYYLPGSEFMTDIYVRFRNASGTNGVYLRLGALRFDVTRKIQSGGVPLQPVGNSTAYLSCNASFSKSVDIAGSFRSIKHMV